MKSRFYTSRAEYRFLKGAIYSRLLQQSKSKIQSYDRHMGKSIRTTKEKQNDYIF